MYWLILSVLFLIAGIACIDLFATPAQKSNLFFFFTLQALGMGAFFMGIFVSHSRKKYMKEPA